MHFYLLRWLAITCDYTLYMIREEKSSDACECELERCVTWTECAGCLW